MSMIERFPQPSDLEDDVAALAVQFPPVLDELALLSAEHRQRIVAVSDDLHSRVGGLKPAVQQVKAR